MPIHYVGSNHIALLLSCNFNFINNSKHTHTMQTEIFDDFIPYWDDSTETDYDYQTETETTENEQSTETNTESNSIELPF